MTRTVAVCEHVGNFISVMDGARNSHSELKKEAESGLIITSSQYQTLQHGQVDNGSRVATHTSLRGDCIAH